MISAAEASSKTQERIAYLAQAEKARETTLLEVRKVAERIVEEAIQSGKFETEIFEFENAGDYPLGVSLFIEEAQKLGYKVLSDATKEAVKLGLQWDGGAEIPVAKS